MLSDYDSLPALKRITIDGDSLTFDDFTASTASLYQEGNITSEQKGNTLPVNFMSFNAKVVDGRVALNWATANEINNSHFEVQMSLNAVNFEEIAKVAGTNSALSSYAFKGVEGLFGTYYFRLKQVGFDGSSSYSNIISVQSRKTKIKLLDDGSGKSIVLPGSFAPFRSADIKQVSPIMVTLSGRQNNVTFVKSGSTVKADYAEMKIVLKKL